jgi:hypothetical protein
MEEMIMPDDVQITTDANAAFDRVLDQAIKAARNRDGVVNTYAAAEKAIELLDEMMPGELASEIYHALTITALRLALANRAPAKGSA